MDVTRYPSVDVPVVTATLANPGAPASVMEQEVAIPVEAAFDGLRGVRHIHTTVGQGFAVVTAEFTVDTDSAAALAAVESALQKAKPSLPATIEEPKAKLVDV